MKVPIDLAISHLIFALQSGTILSKLQSNTNSTPISSYKSFISLLSLTSRLNSIPKDSELQINEVVLNGNTVCGLLIIRLLYFITSV